MLKISNIFTDNREFTNKISIRLLNLIKIPLILMQLFERKERRKVNPRNN